MIGGSSDGPQEIEGEPALSLTLGVLPEVHCSNIALLCLCDKPVEDAMDKQLLQRALLLAVPAVTQSICN